MLLKKYHLSKVLKGNKLHWYYIILSSTNKAALNGIPLIPQFKQIKSDKAREADEIMHKRV
jgi:hypothetical protein